MMEDIRDTSVAHGRSSRFGPWSSIPESFGGEEEQKTEAETYSQSNDPVMD